MIRIRLAATLLLAAGMVTAAAQAGPPDNFVWPSNWPLPAFETPAEKAAPPEAPSDDITPPPAEPVRAVAEFELQEGVQLAYPFNPWNEMFVEMVREIQEVAIAYIVVPDLAAKAECVLLLQQNAVPLNNIEFQIHAIDGMWSRDYGAHYVWGQTSGEIAMIDWQYYDERPNDDEIPDFQANLWHMNFYETGIYHEGGNYMSDGHGTAMCSDVLYNNNPGWTQAQCRQAVMNYFGVDTVHVYQRIPYLYDGTGHIDLWGKMLNDTTIMVAQLQTSDPNYAMIEGHAAAMAQVPTIYGTPFHIVRCPMPAPSWFYFWFYYKSFLNSVIVNGKVLVPIYATEPALTQQALAAYQSAMPGYEVVGIYSDAIAPAGGAIHCTTIGVASHPQDYIHNADVTATPIGGPITLPPGGGTFQYSASLHNLETDSIYTEVWAELRLPSGAPYGPLFERSVALGANGTVSRTLQQAVPGSAPGGTYHMVVYTGSRLPRVVNDSSFFAFTKSGVDGAASEDMRGWTVEELEVRSSFVTASTPEDFTVLKAYPNPFNPATALSFELPSAAHVSLRVYDTAGRLVATLADGWKEAGSYQVPFQSFTLASGVYVARLEAGGAVSTEKLVLMK
ncbi:MAG: T9SS C-terminal target domain-containing protein [Candidatus Zixiibacteriota bacterium]|nr:MAG: T9SS C-terminal target domain-containing protein [candidate division Zixibacteria bacterium]